MKTIILLLVTGIISQGVYTQTGDTAKIVEETLPAIAPEEEDDTSDAYKGQKNIAVEERGDTTKIRVGKKGIKIIEDSDGETSIQVSRLDENDFKEETFFHEEKKKKFEGHWSGIELGLNNFMDADYSISRDQASNYMDLHTGKSWNFNLNIFQYDLGFGTDRVGFVTGLGIEFSNYRFDGNNNIQKADDTNYIIELDYARNLEKSKLSTTYLTVPLLLEGQLFGGSGNERMHVTAGVIGGLKIGSSTKIVYREDGKKQKDKVRDDFNLSPFRYGLTARVGIDDLSIYANYYLTPLFEENKGPELYPVAAGLVLSF
jgi:hypothetical protein